MSEHNPAVLVEWHLHKDVGNKILEAKADGKIWREWIRRLNPHNRGYIENPEWVTTEEFYDELRKIHEDFIKSESARTGEDYISIYVKYFRVDQAIDYWLKNL